MKQSVNREILRLAWPAVLTNVTTPLLSLADVAVAGHIGAARYIGAIAVGGAVFSMIYWIFNFLRMGTSGMTAQAFGRNDSAECLRTALRGLCIAFVAGLVIVMLQAWLAGPVVRFVDDGSDAVASIAGCYLRAAIWGAPAQLATFVLTGWFVGMQTSRPVLVMAVCSNVLNIALSVALVFLLDFGIEGIGAATAVAQWIGLLAGLAMATNIVRKLNIGSGLLAFPAIFNFVAMRRFLSVNIDICLRTMCLVAVTVMFTRFGASLGTDILAVNALLMQLVLLFSYFSDGFAFAAEALTGRFTGAGDNANLRTTIRSLFAWGALLAGVMTLVYVFFAQPMLGLFTDDPDVAAAAAVFSPWAAAVPLVGFAAFVWDGVYIGMTRTRLMLVAMASAMVVFFAVWFAGGRALGNHGLWLAYTLYLLTRGLSETITYKLVIARKK